MFRKFEFHNCFNLIKIKYLVFTKFISFLMIKENTDNKQRIYVKKGRTYNKLIEVDVAPFKNIRVIILLI